MTPSAAPLSRDAGLSLVEVLAAIAIVAVLSSAVVIYWGGGSSPARETADRLALRLTEARQQALVSGETVGFAADFDGTGWRFFRFRDGFWREIDDHPAFVGERLSQGVNLSIRAGAIPRRQIDDSLDAPEVLFDPTGFDAPFEYEIRDRDTQLIVRRTDAGAVRVETFGFELERAES